MAAFQNPLEEMRAALAPTLEATAAILPWVAKPKKLRFPPEAAGRWLELCRRLDAIWSGRHAEAPAGLRPAVFELCAVALELGDIDCLRLSEALATATDRLEIADQASDARLSAALSATFECLIDGECLEHPAFSERARHFAERLERCADPQSAQQLRSPVLERLFAAEAGECVERIHEAFAALPPDAYGIKLAAGEITRLAEPLELDHIAALANRLLRRLAPPDGKAVDLEAGDIRGAALALVGELEKAIARVAAG